MMTLNKSNTTLNTQAVLSMKSSGYYSQRTAGAKIAIDSIQPLMEKAIIEIPKLPISGDDLKKHGYASGRELGKKLKFLEEKWIENNFTLKQEYIEKYLNKNKRN